MLSGRILRRFPHVRLRASLPTTVALPQPRGFATPSANDLFANGTNTYYAEEMYRHWKEDPKSVHPSWDVYFSGLEKGLPSSSAFQKAPSVMPAPSDGAPALHASSGAELDDHLKVCLPVFLLTHINKPSRRNSSFAPTKSAVITSLSLTPWVFSTLTSIAPDLRNSSCRAMGSRNVTSRKRSRWGLESYPTSRPRTQRR